MGERAAHEQLGLVLRLASHRQQGLAWTFLQAEIARSTNGKRLGYALTLPTQPPFPPLLPVQLVLTSLHHSADASSDEDTKKPTTAPAAPPIPAVVPKKGRFADEDASDDDVKDSWDVSDDSDDDDKAKKKPAVVVGSMRNKGSVKQKIAAREQEEARKAEEAERLVRPRG